MSQDDVAETFELEELLSVRTDYHLVTSVCILVFAFSMQFMVFPTYVELEKRSTSRYATVSKISTTIYTMAYLATAAAGVLLFGTKIQPDILTNIAKITGKVSIFIRLSYSFLMLLHIPYFFFSIKEYVLVLFDEVMNRSMSQHLE